MTESEWLTSADGVKLVKHWDERFTERKARLLMLACCRRRETHFTHPVMREAVAMLAAHYADPLAPDRPFEGSNYCALHARVDEYIETDPLDPVFWVACAVKVAAKPNSIVAEHNQTLPWLPSSCLSDAATESDDASVAGEAEAQALLAREVLGNPFRPVTIDPAWRTETVLALTRQMYATEDFSATSILADALQDAGCNDDGVLNHLRHEPHHVRGCWVLDLILGKL